MDLCVAKIKRNFNSSQTLTSENKDPTIDQQASLKVCVVNIFYLVFVFLLNQNMYMSLNRFR